MSANASRLNGPVSAPSPTPSNASGTGAKRKRPEGGSTPRPGVTSTPSGMRNNANANTQPQPADRKAGFIILTDVTHTIDWLKEKGTPQPWSEIARYITLDKKSEHHGSLVRRALALNGRVRYDSRGAGGEGTFAFQPKFNIHNADDLLRELQRRDTAVPFGIKELKEGWPDVAAEVDRLAAEGKVLVSRNKKDQSPKVVWANDPTLKPDISDTFRNQFMGITPPADIDELRKSLEQAGLKPASAPREIKKGVSAKDKKRKAPRRGGKTTNTHMVGILRDYSHKRK